jgi:hypothetical protein
MDSNGHFTNAKCEQTTSIYIKQLLIQQYQEHKQRLQIQSQQQDADRPQRFISEARTKRHQPTSSSGVARYWVRSETESFEKSRAGGERHDTYIPRSSAGHDVCWQIDRFLFFALFFCSRSKTKSPCEVLLVCLCARLEVRLFVES